MSKRSYAPLHDKSSALSPSTARRARAAQGASSSSLVLGLTTTLGELTKMCAKLERSLARLGTANDSAAFRQLIHKDQRDAQQLVKASIESLAAAQPLLDARQYKRLGLQFEQVHKKYTALTRQLDNKQQHSGAQSQHDGSYGQRNNTGYDDYRQPLTSNSADYYSSQQQRRTAEDDVLFTETEHEEIVRRVEEIAHIESEVAEVATLYADLHALVGEQQTSIDTIGEHVEVVQHKVEAANVQIERASGHQRYARKWKCCTAVVVLLVISVAIVVLLVLKKSNVF